MKSAKSAASTFGVNVTSVTAIAKNSGNALKDIIANTASTSTRNVVNAFAMNAASVILTAKNSASAL